MEYEVANGQSLFNLGMKRLDVMTTGSNWVKRSDVQVSEVHKPLLALGQVTEMGYGAVLEKRGGYLEDEHSGETIPLRKDGNLYMMRMWVRQATGNTDFHCGVRREGPEAKPLVHQ